MTLSVKHLSSPLSSHRAAYAVTIRSQTNHTEPLSGVNVCLINHDSNQAVLQRLAPYPVPFTKYLPVKHEFEGADVGGIHKVLLAPECGELVIDSIEVVKDEDAPMTFVPSTAHDNVFIPRREFSPELKAQYDNEYVKLKDDINMRALIYAAVGTTCTAATLGPNEAYAFAIGTALASIYNVMLQIDVDNFGTPKRKTIDATRLVVLACVAGLVVKNHGAEIRAHNIYYVLGLLGFMSHKMSIMRSVK